MDIFLPTLPGKEGIYIVRTFYWTLLYHLLQLGLFTYFVPAVCKMQILHEEGVHCDRVSWLVMGVWVFAFIEDCPNAQGCGVACASKFPVNQTLVSVVRLSLINGLEWSEVVPFPMKKGKNEFYNLVG